MINHYSAGIVVYRMHEGQTLYLILQYAAGHWDFPKGHMDPGETKEETAVRELREETGLTAHIDPGFEMSFSYSFMQNGDQHFKEVYFFKGKVDTADVQLSSEHLDYRWLNYEDALAQLTYDNAKALLGEVERVNQL